MLFFFSLLWSLKLLLKIPNQSYQGKYQYKTPARFKISCQLEQIYVHNLHSVIIIVSILKHATTELAADQKKILFPGIRTTKLQ